MAAARTISRLSPQTTALLICDMQEQFRSTVKHFLEITQTTQRLLKAAALLDMKVVATEHHGYGGVVKELELEKYKVEVFKKQKYSMCTSELMESIGSCKSALLCGGETHVCVWQTVLDLMEKDIDVRVVVDATSACHYVERLFGFRQIEHVGALLTTTETVISELIGGSDHPKSDEVCELLKCKMPDTGLGGYAM